MNCGFKTIGAVLTNKIDYAILKKGINNNVGS